MKNIPEPTDEQRKLFSELRLPNNRVDIKRLLNDPKYLKLRRYMMTRSVMVTQAREDIDTDWKTVYDMVVFNER